MLGLFIAADQQAENFFVAEEKSPAGFRLVQAIRFQVGRLFRHQFVGSQPSQRVNQLVQIGLLRFGRQWLGQFPGAVDFGKGGFARASLQ